MRGNGTVLQTGSVDGLLRCHPHPLGSGLSLCSASLPVSGAPQGRRARLVLWEVHLDAHLNGLGPDQSCELITSVQTPSP